MGDLQMKLYTAFFVQKGSTLPYQLHPTKSPKHKGLKDQNQATSYWNYQR